MKNLFKKARQLSKNSNDTGNIDGDFAEKSSITMDSIAYVNDENESASPNEATNFLNGETSATRKMVEGIHEIIMSLNEKDLKGGNEYFDQEKRIDFVLAYNNNENDNDESSKNDGDETDGVNTNNYVDYTNDNNETNEVTNVANEQNKNNHKKLDKITKRQCFLKNLKKEGLELRYWKSIDKSLTYIFIHAPEDKLFEYAEKTRYKVPIAINNLKKMDTVTEFWNKIPNPFKLSDDHFPNKTERKYFTAPYDSKLDEKFREFWREEDLTHENFISPKDRSLLTYEVLSRTSYVSNENDDERIGIERLIANGSFQAAFPLHEELDKDLSSKEEMNNRTKLYFYWARLRSINYLKYQPLSAIRDYFGEKVAFYFSWLGFYTSWLFVPAVIGFFVFIFGLVTLPFDTPTNEICDKNGTGNFLMCPLCAIRSRSDDSESQSELCPPWKLYDSCLYSKVTHVFDNAGTVFFSIIMALWTVLFIEFWKRQQNTYKFEWDTIDYESKYDVMRPEYEIKSKKLKFKKHPITEEPYVPFLRRLKNYSISVAAVLFMICLVLALLLGIIVYRVSIYVAVSKSIDLRRYSNYIASMSAALINLVFILVLNRIYTKLAIKLTDLELHKTDVAYEDSFTVKIYLFQFVNFYSSIFYIAFFKGRIGNLRDEESGSWYSEPCDPSGCLVELCIQLAIIMIGKQVINNIQEHLYPIISNFLSRRSYNQQNHSDTSYLPQWEKDYTLSAWGKMTLFDEYLEMVIQYGFITLFVVAFPLAPLFAFLNNILEIRIDANKFLVHSRRPLAKKARDIGIWLSILNTVSKIGVITNGLIIAFTSEFIPRIVYLISQNKNDLKGFVNYSLSEFLLSDMGNSTTFENNSTVICRYRDFREPPDSPRKYKITTEFYHVMVARLAFIVVFEHVVFFAVTCLHWIIRDVPTIIKHQIEKENLLIQRAVWQKEGQLSAKAALSIRSLNRRNLDVN